LRQARILGRIEPVISSKRYPEAIGAHLVTALAAPASGRLPYVPPEVVPVAEVADVHRRFEAGTGSGRTVLRM
jgi:NADPH2:quinone reductase